ncbi:hypothetical protein [Pseudomarimonas salicorniae]|uniref:Protein TonB n=1 Tax=Pseudomarimonas salicorniae TaxID=2933270 RepID=A0ABT0GL34_9GAMM|nr:hypothetical protein [Lysobacter sp. CAU 1642]MCK7594944.1 hypothetical protein [Lysobacter sp. CAU 1642]
MIDPAAALAVEARAPRADRDRAVSAIRFAGAALAVGLHAMLIWGWIQVSRWQPETPPRTIEVIFLTDSAAPDQAVPPMPVPPARPIRKVASPRPDPSSTSRLQAVEVARDAPARPEEAPSLRLFRPDGGLVLPESRTEVPAFDDRARITFDRRVALPGSTDAAYAEVVALRLRRAFTPEDVVLAVLRFLGGGAQPDDCRKIEARLVASDPDVSREIDMNKFSRFCK